LINGYGVLRMLQNDLDRLSQARLKRSLATLESDIWRGVAARLVERRSDARAFTAQIMILALGTVGSVTVGHWWVTAHEPVTSRGALAPYTRLAASDLLVSVTP
jgi:hypothetical protein